MALLVGNRRVSDGRIPDKLLVWQKPPIAVIIIREIRGIQKSALIPRRFLDFARIPRDSYPTIGDIPPPIMVYRRFDNGWISDKLSVRQKSSFPVIIIRGVREIREIKKQNALIPRRFSHFPELRAVVCHQPSH